MIDNVAFLNLLNNNRNQAFAILYKEAFPMVKSWAYKNNLTLEDAKELLQDGVIAFHRNSLKDGFYLNVSPITYFGGILKNLILKRHHDRKIKVEFLEIHSDMVDEVETSDNYTIKEKLLGELLSKIGDRCLKIIKDFYYKKLTFEEIANSNKNYKNADSAKAQKSKCMKNLRELSKKHLL